MRILSLLLFCLVCVPAMAAVPDYSPIDVPSLVGTPHNNSDEYVVLDLQLDLGQTGTPGIYRWDDLAADPAAPPALPLTYLQYSGGQWAIIDLGDGSGILPMHIAGDVVYGNRLSAASENIFDDLYMCPMDQLLAGPATSACTLMSDQYSAPLGGEYATASGWLAAVTQGIGLDHYMFYPPPGSGLAPKAVPLGDAVYVADMRSNAAGTRVHVLLTSLGQPGIGDVVVIEVSGGDWTFHRVALDLSTAPVLPPEQGFTPMAISPPDASYPGAGNFRVAFAGRSLLDTVPAPIYAADFSYDPAASQAALVQQPVDADGDSYFELTGSTAELQGVNVVDGGALGIRRSRITNDGALVTLIGDDAGGLADIGWIDLAMPGADLASIENGVAIQRSTTPLLSQPPTDNASVVLAISECGNVTVTANADWDISSDYETVIFQNAPCGSGAPSSNVVTLSAPSGVINPAETSQITVDVLLDSQTVHGIDMSCSADDQVLQLVDGQLAGLFPSGSLVVGPTSSGNEWQVAVARSGTDEPLLASGVFATLTYNVLTTTAVTDVTCVAEGSDGQGNPVDVAVVPAEVSVDDGIHGGSGSLSGQVQLPVGEDHSGILVTIHRDGHEYSTYTDADGNFVFSGLRDGAFSVTYAADFYVADCDSASIISGGSVTLAPTQMIAGDINADGTIDIGDFTLLAGAYGTATGDAAYVPEADLNADGGINIRDLSILGSHFGLNTCDPSDLVLGCGMDTLEDAQVAFQDPAMDISLNGMSVTMSNLSAPANASTYSAVAKNVFTQASGSTYMELVYEAGQGTDTDSGVAAAFMDGQAPAQAVFILPGRGEVRVGNDPATSTVVFSGLSVTPGYTVGMAVNHDTGAIIVQDSLGNSVTLADGTVPQGQSFFFATAGQPGLDAGDSITGRINVMSGDFLLTPPAGSQDWCGNLL